MDSYLAALEEYNSRFEKAMQAFDDYLKPTEAEQREIDAIGAALQQEADLNRILDEVERVHGMKIDRYTVANNLRGAL